MDSRWVPLGKPDGGLGLLSTVAGALFHGEVWGTRDYSLAVYRRGSRGERGLGRRRDTRIELGLGIQRVERVSEMGGVVRRLVSICRWWRVGVVCSVRIHVEGRCHRGHMGTRGTDGDVWRREGRRESGRD